MYYIHIYMLCSIIFVCFLRVCACVHVCMCACVWTQPAVVDSMYVKMRSYNAKLGIDMLTVMPVSKASGMSL